jgi:hypothetical protein
MGNLLALSLGCTLVATLLFLPALLGPAKTDPSDPRAAPIP